MKSKILSLFLLTAILGLAMISAAPFTITQPGDLSKTVTNTSFTITNPNNSTITVNIPNFESLNDADGHTIYITQDKFGPLDINAGGSSTVQISYSLDNDSDFDNSDLNSLGKLALGAFSKSITINSGNETQQATLNFISSFCERGERRSSTDDRELEIVRVRDESSEDDWEWKPLDEVEVSVDVRFNSDDNDDSIDGVIELALYDTEEKTFIDFDNQDDAQIEFSLDEGEKTTETFKLTVPVEDLEDDSSRYKLYVKAYEDGEEETVCTDTLGSDYFKDIKITKEDYQVNLNRLDVTSPAPCGQEAQVTGVVYNLGSHDEENVLIHLSNKELGIDLVSQPMDLAEGDSKKFTFNFVIPENASEKSHNLKLWSEFRYRESSDTYRDRSDDYTLALKVEGDCKVESQRSASITATLDEQTPQAVAGEQLIIKSTLKNTGKTTTAYGIAIEGNTGWSSLSSIEPKTFILNAGESKDISITLDVDKETEGEKEFTIKADFEGGSAEQKVALSIIKNNAIDSNAIIGHIQNNWFIYVIALINIILIIAIILVVKSMVARPSR